MPKKVEKCTNIDKKNDPLTMKYRKKCIIKFDPLNSAKYKSNFFEDELQI